jgi:hypothetical protein
MSLDFTIQKDPKKTIELDITPEDLDDINLDELNNINFDDKSDDPIFFTKEKLGGLDNLFNVPTGKKTPTKPKANVKREEVKVNVKKEDTRPNIQHTQPHKKPIIEPGSMDLGLDKIANQKKKNVQPDELSLSTQGSGNSKRSSKSNRSLSIDFNDLDKVKNIMDEKSEHSNDSKKSSSSSLSSKIKERVTQKTYANEAERKQELLFLFDKLEKKGIRIPQKFTLRSSIEEMEKTYERLKNERELQNSIKFQRRVLMGVVSTVEFLNHSMNPFDIDLDGWSESVMENYSEYDDIFEELYEKYKNKGHISPEVKLIMTLAGGAFYFHLSKMIIKPAQQKMQEMFADMEAGGPRGDGNIDMSGLMGGGFMSGLMNNFMGGGNSKPKQTTGGGGGMRGPQGFDDILTKDDGSDIPSIRSDVSAPKVKKQGKSLHL